jgi:hypothetical protein
MRTITTNPGGTIFNRLTQRMASADDVAIIGRNVNALKQTFIELTKEARKLGLVVKKKNLICDCIPKREQI